ncbi:pre-rRNA-processing protein TSR1 homolog [Tribolium castaneum]|uniref:Pre-rRNA-processing protein TSR1 homolog n=1 Tax=Tribolium castaneum TaxID=7070 RepID=D7EJ12_TRICA|nr:PREDICTED: pre-rRNA-processing protein TSR1 homolog [Tribolium castaneum]EFA12491.1 Pre-rRNA-processing protein TSR1 homolog-like Protein [Tribolium castaneum]|eukprot:XP_008200089.1 PREDICTED: pre-rRNA-processing protein TSR1 homolog [Tribolium castaneum]
MGVDKAQSHRPGLFKQSNKAHKHGRHRSKGSISSDAKGKISVKTLSKKIKRGLNRDERRHQALQIRQNKRNDVLNKKRSLGGLDFAPFLVAVVPLNKLGDCKGVVECLAKCDSEAIINKSPTGVTHIYAPRFKQKFSFIVPSTENELAILDALKICDTVVFLMSVTGGVEEENLIDKSGQNILMSSFAQGLPTPVIVLSDLNTLAQKKRHDYKQQAQKLITKWFPDEKLVTLENESDGINLLRKIGNQKRRSVLYRDRRPHIYAEDYAFIPDETGPYGTLKITGYLRGAALSVNGLVHLPGIGDFQMAQIDAPFHPFAVDKIKNKNVTGMDSNEKSDTRVLDKADPAKQESLDAENVPDPMDAEQTWPTNEEIEMAEQENKVKKVKKVPKGWSDYQAAWIPDDDTEFLEDNGSSDEESDQYMDAMSEEKSDNSDQEDQDFDTVTESEVAPNDEKYDQEMDFLAERQELEKLKAARSDKMFPDEVDTPLDQPARVRFQKYRGLESFRTSPWDPKENLPSDYARIFQFENFDRTKKRILKELEDVDGAKPGWYITVHIKNVSQLSWSNFGKVGAPLVLFGLLPHEYKMSVINVVLKRTPNYSLPIKSKERLIFQCGYRKFVTNPIFSQHTNGQKHKFERYFQPESTVVATFYGRIQFPPAPVLCYKEENGKLVLVATGSLLSCNPDRIILKRIVLSGHPFKIYKRSAVIRFLFFNREDIIYFKPCKLRTKMGRVGHIKEPLGTHGHIKCIFDGQLKSQDTVLLNLYKRVFPKWIYEDLVVSVASNEEMET